MYSALSSALSSGLTALAAIGLASFIAPVGASPVRAGEGGPQDAPPASVAERREGSPAADDGGSDWTRERGWLEEARAALRGSDYDEARQKIGQAVERLLAAPRARRQGGWLELLDFAGRLAWEAQHTSVAKSAWEEVLAVRTETLPPDHPELQQARQNLALAIKWLGDLRGALELEEQAVEVLERTLPDDHSDLQRARGNLAATRYSLGDLSGALALHERVLEVFSRTLDEDHPHLQLARQNMAAMLAQRGDPSRARELHEQVLEARLRTHPADHPDLQAARVNLGAAKYSSGDLPGARALFEQALEVYDRTQPADHPHLQAARQGLALTLKRLGDPQSARALEETVLEVQLRTLPADHPDVQLARGNLAGTLWALGDLQGARMLFEQVLEVRSRLLPPDHPELQSARSSLAATSRELGQLELARELEERVLEVYTRIYHQDHPSLQAARGNLAATLHLSGELERSRELLEGAQEAYARTRPVDDASLLATRMNLAATLSVLGDLDGAREIAERVLDILARTRRDDDPELQAARMNLCLTIADVGARAAPAAGRPQPQPEGAAAQRELCASLLNALCRSQTLAAREAIVSSSRREAEERCARLAESLDVVLSFALGYGNLETLPEILPEAFALSESTRGGSLAWATLARDGAGSARHEQLRASLRQESERLTALARGGTTSAEFQAALATREALERQLLGEARELSGGSASGIEIDAAALASALEPGEAAIAFRRFERWNPTQAEVARGRDGGARAHERVESLCAFVLRAGEGGPGDGAQPLTMVALGPLAPIEEAVRAWRAAIGLGVERGIGLGAEGRELLAERGEVLRRLVLDPILAEIDDARRLVVVLDDVLHLVPLDALPLGAGAGGTAAARELVGERFRIEQRNGLGELLARATREPGPNLLLALGGASFNSEPLGANTEDLAQEGGEGAEPGRRVASILRDSIWERGFAPLTYSGLEARGIAVLHEEMFDHGEAIVLERRRASRGSLEALAPRARWLHVATHGWYASESIRSWSDPEPLDRHAGLGFRPSGEEQIRGMSPMLLCGLALAGANLPEDALGRAPGLMTAEELSTLDLTSCELAVLSACDTNVGVRRAGQGVASLQRALQMAGARSVITSLWKVPDEATRELMLDFYRRLWVEKKPKHQALWEAKMRLRDARDERGSPLYTLRDWGAWVLTGEPD